MGEFRNKVTNLASIGIADISVKGISAIFWFYVAAILGPSGYGEIAYLLSVAMIASTVALLGAGNTLIVYTAKNVKIQSALYVLTLISGSITSIVVFFIFYDVGTSFLILGYVIFGLISSELLGYKLYKNYSKLIISQRALMVVLSIGMFYIFGQEAILIGIALSFSPYLISIIRGFKKIKINFSLVKERFNFLINSYLHTMVATLNGSVDKLIIAPFFGFALLGNYSLGLQFLSLLQIIPMAVTKYIIPQDSSGIENRKLKRITILTSVGLAILGLTIGPFAISFIFPEFGEAKDVIRIVSLSIVPSTVVLMYQSKFLGQEKNRNVLISSSIWVGTQITAIIILGSIYGINGVASAMVLGATASMIYVLIADQLDKKKLKNPD
jgi:O-antigen/teichoic acid export membrane protein